MMNMFFNESDSKSDTLEPLDGGGKTVVLSAVREDDIQPRTTNALRMRTTGGYDEGQKELKDMLVQYIQVSWQRERALLEQVLVIVQFMEHLKNDLQGI